MKIASLRLPDEIFQRLDRLAARTGRSKTFYMQAAIQEHLDDLEDLYLAEQRLIDIRAGKSQTVPLEEVMERYGLEDRAGPRRGSNAQERLAPGASHAPDQDEGVAGRLLPARRLYL